MEQGAREGGAGSPPRWLQNGRGLRARGGPGRAQNAFPRSPTSREREGFALLLGQFWVPNGHGCGSGVILTVLQPPAAPQHAGAPPPRPHSPPPSHQSVSVLHFMSPRANRIPQAGWEKVVSFQISPVLCWGPSALAGCVGPASLTFLHDGFAGRGDKALEMITSWVTSGT